MAEKKMRICNVICDITSGGVESVLMNYFGHIDRTKYETDLLTYGISSEVCAEEFRSLGFRITKITPKRENFLKSIREMDKAIRVGCYDVVHAHMSEWNFIPLFLAWKHGVKIRICHSHTATFSAGLNLPQRLLLRVQRGLNYCFSTKFCACGKAASVYLYGKHGYRAREIHILNNAIDVRRFAFREDVRFEVRRELGIGPETLCVGHVGRFLEEKNHTFLIDIFAEVHRLKPDSCLLLLGVGPLGEKIRQKVRSLGIEDGVKFLGVRGDPERMYQGMDVLCLPSLFEGLPVTGIEAQAAGLPCLMSTAISEEVRITPLVRMMSLKKPALKWAQELISISGRKEACPFPDAFDIEKMSSKWEELYR